jgi:serine/threonine-protein kinase HipA
VKRGIVHCCGIRAGVLERNDAGFVFRYDAAYLANPALPPVSATLPKSVAEHRSRHLFPFFFGLLAEGAQKERQCRELRIDENDSFSLLLATSAYGAIGAVHVEPETGAPC